MATKSPKTNKGKIAAMETRRRCVELRRSGATYDQIAAQLGISKVSAYRHVQKHLEETARVTGESAEVVRALELERLDRMQLGAYTRAITGDDQAINSVLKIMDRRARITGIDAPAKIAPTDPTGDGEFSGGLGLAAMVMEMKKAKGQK